jgi:hypothetical protein
MRTVGLFVKKFLIALSARLFPPSRRAAMAAPSSPRRPAEPGASGAAESLARFAPSREIVVQPSAFPPTRRPQGWRSVIRIRSRRPLRSRMRAGEFKA